MKCKVTLCGKDNTQNLSSAGELILNKTGFLLSYDFDGDKCILSYDKEKLCHEKSGEIPVLIEFVLNKKTLCKIGSGNLYGEIPVFTNSLNVHMGTKSVSVAVFYNLDGEENQMQILAETIN